MRLVVLRDNGTSDAYLVFGCRGGGVTGPAGFLTTTIVDCCFGSDAVGLAVASALPLHVAVFACCCGRADLTAAVVCCRIVDRVCWCCDARAVVFVA